jgi:hypothetical protein
MNFSALIDQALERAGVPDMPRATVRELTKAAEKQLEDILSEQVIQNLWTRNRVDDLSAEDLPEQFKDRIDAAISPPIIKEADPELERLLNEETFIEWQSVETAINKKIDDLETLCKQWRDLRTAGQTIFQLTNIDYTTRAGLLERIIKQYKDRV